MSRLTAFLAGLVFALGLVVGGMTQPAKVIGFLDVGGGWDPSLAFVMAGALVVYGIGFRLVTPRAAPLFADVFRIPTRTDTPPRLFVGAGLFGVGWAMAGFCTGPAVVALGSGMPEAVWFFSGLVGGMLAFRLFDQTEAATSDAAAR